MRLRRLHQWLVLALCWSAVSALPHALIAVEAEATARSDVKVMFLFKEVGEEGIQAVENALTRAFERHGYSVLDHEIVTQTLHREADLLQLYEIEAAKLVGSRLGATIVVSGRSRSRATEKTYSSLGDKKVTVSQADVGAKAILVSSGKVLVAENAHARTPFDTTGDIALEKAAESLAAKLIEGIEQFLRRETIDYRLVILNIDHPQSQALQDALRHQGQVVQQVTEHAFIQNTLELAVSVAKKQDVTFKTTLFGGGFGGFTVVAREGETIYLQRTGKAVSRESKTQPSDGDKGSKRTEGGKEEIPPSASVTSYKRGYRKSWAVVIGINNYQQWPKLAYAVNDAEAIMTRLKGLGFDEVIPILDEAATQQQILRILGDELYAKTEDDDRVFIFYAGHGQTQDLPNGSKMGYIIPVDGDLKNYYSTAISMRQLQDLSDRLRAKHIFYAMDSCFSGLILRSRGEATPDYYAQTMAPVRQVLTAGSEGEEVVEIGGHGLFTKVLLAGLGGEADLNGDGSIMASEIYRFVTPRVLQESQNTQNPVFGQLGHGRGEFMFVLKQ